MLPNVTGKSNNQGSNKNWTQVLDLDKVSPIPPPQKKNLKPLLCHIKAIIVNIKINLF